MTGYLLDTNVVSETIKPQPDLKVTRFLEENDNVFISVVTLAEMSFGVARLASGRRKDALGKFVSDISLASANLLAVKPAISIKSGSLRAKSESMGRRLHWPDAFIAATAHDAMLTLVTRNIRDFDGLGLSLHNPWSA